MKNRFVILFVFLAIISSLADAQGAYGAYVTLLGPGRTAGRTNFYQTTNYHCTLAGSPYMITGTFFIDNNSTFTIDPGVVIYGDSTSSFVVRPGSKIYAQGTATQPIIFSSYKPAGQQAPGDWGGVIILGNAPTNQTPAPQIEGGIIPGTYGGASAGVGDPHDSSGVLSYIRIEFAGYRYQLNNEINGLTFGGVGDHTKVDHIEVAYAYDDSFEWFGGTVNCDHLIAFGGTDDEFDTDFGFSGSLQFGFALRDPYIWDPTGESNGFESDNMEPSSGWTTNPRTTVRENNCTLVGPRRTDGTAYIPGQRFQYAVVDRRGSEISIYNSYILGYPGGYSLRDLPTAQALNSGASEVRCLTLANVGEQSMKMLDFRSITGADSVTALGLLTSNGNIGCNTSRTPSAAGLINLSDLTNPDPRPTLGESVDYTHGAGLAPFVAVSYRGAFDPSLSMNNQWGGNFNSWTKFDYNENSTTTSALTAGWNLVSIARGVSDYTPTNVITGAVAGTIYGYNGTSYTNPTTLQNGNAYWAQYTSAGNLIVTGKNLAGVSQKVTIAAGASGWVMFGTPSTRDLPLSRIEVAVSNPTGIDPASGLLPSGGRDMYRIEANTLYGYNGTSYFTPTTVQPGKGYWILLNGGPATNSFPSANGDPMYGGAMTISCGQ